MKGTYLTSRLLLNELLPDDHAFIRELVNMPEWIRFIGNRNVGTEEEARAYIQKILDNPNVRYRVARLKDAATSIGIITFIKREYLEHWDIGFAFLSAYGKQGYAYEAAAAVLEDVSHDAAHSKILATTIKENVSSIRLLEKLGLRFEREIKNADELLSVYSTGKK
jgi:[ribosomal protein S5]-alanine N-acetyltransferase